VTQTPFEHLAEIRGLVDAYAVAMDEADLETLPRLFVPDGRLIVRALDREKPLAVFGASGPDGVGLIARLLHELYRATLHSITTHHVHLDGDEALGSTYCLAYHVIAGDAVETLAVRYAERFVRTPEGWRFHTRDATRLWSQVTPTPQRPLLLDHAAARAR
jgi:hypothetical protein